MTRTPSACEPINPKTEEPEPEIDVAATLRELKNLHAQRDAAEARMLTFLQDLGYDD